MVGKEELVSVVVPVYNCESYIENCIESIISQTYRNLDIILVNDGSTDGSVQICEKYVEADSRIRLIGGRENRGAASARRDGTLQAEGHFIVYVDSDDRISETYIDNLMLENRDVKADLVISRFIDSNGELYQNCLPIGEYTSEELLMQSMGENDVIRKLFGYMHAKLFITETAARAYGCIDEEICLGEDQDFGFSYYLLCKIVRIIDNCEYFYTIRGDSLVHQAQNEDKWLENYGRIFLSMKKNMCGHIEKENLAHYLKTRIFETYMNLFSMMGITYAVALPVFDLPECNGVLAGGKKIVLYGAGNVGQSYFLQLKKRGTMPVLWVDGNIQKYDFLKTELSQVVDILSVEYDYVLIGVVKKSTAEKIRQRLIELGVHEKDILWEEPRSGFFRV